MEEVWREINLSSLHDHPPAAATSFRNGCPATAVSLQDFLARPFHKDIHNDPFSHHSPSAAAAATYSVPPPTAVLGLNFQTTGPVPGKIRVPEAAQLHDRGSLYVHHFHCKSRAPPPEEDGSERKRKRLMKNRESAVRSRARKQAYTNELETELEQLQDENAKLRRQYHELRLAGPALLPQKHSLRRTLTAPF